MAAQNGQLELRGEKLDHTYTSAYAVVAYRQILRESLARCALIRKFSEIFRQFLHQILRKPCLRFRPTLIPGASDVVPARTSRLHAPVHSHPPLSAATACVPARHPQISASRLVPGNRHDHCCSIRICTTAGPPAPVPRGASNSNRQAQLRR